MSIGGRIAKLRKKLNLTQAELAKIVYVSPKTVSKWENEYGLPDIKTIPALAKALGTDMEFLLTGEERGGNGGAQTENKSKPQVKAAARELQAPKVQAVEIDKSAYKLQLHQVTHNHLTKWLVALGIVIIILCIISAPLSEKIIFQGIYGVNEFRINGWLSIFFYSSVSDIQGWAVGISLCWMAVSIYLFISEIIMVYATVNGTNSYYVKTLAIQLACLCILAILSVVGSQITNIIDGEIVLKTNISFFILTMFVFVQLILNILISKHGKRVGMVKGLAAVSLSVLVAFTCVGMALPRNALPTALDESATEMQAVNLQLNLTPAAEGGEYDLYTIEENIIAVKSNVKIKYLMDVKLRYFKEQEQMTYFADHKYISTRYHRGNYYNFFSFSCALDVDKGAKLSNFSLTFKFDNNNSEFAVDVNSVEILKSNEYRNYLTQNNDSFAVTSHHIFYEDTILQGLKYGENAETSLRVGIAKYDGYYPTGEYEWIELADNGANIEIKTVMAKADGDYKMQRECDFTFEFKNMKSLKRFERVEVISNKNNIQYIFRYEDKFLIDGFMRRISGK